MKTIALFLAPAGRLRCSSRWPEVGCLATFSDSRVDGTPPNKLLGRRGERVVAAFVSVLGGGVESLLDFKTLKFGSSSILLNEGQRSRCLICLLVILFVLDRLGQVGGGLVIVSRI